MNILCKPHSLMISLVALMLVALACTCGSLPQATQPPTTQEASPTEIAASATPGEVASEELSQWASSANASSQYGENDWSALQAAGEPNTTSCGDNVTAWASATSTGVDSIELSYPVAVKPTRIDIYQTFNPGAIVKVEVVDSQGTPHSVYEAQPAPTTECPNVQTIDVTQSSITFPVAKVIIHVDQTNHPGWNEIDAVQLTGIP